MDADQVFIYTLLINLCSNTPSLRNIDNPEADKFKCLLRNEQVKTNVLQGKTLRIVTYDDPPLSYTVTSPNGTVEGKGITFELIHTLQKKFGFNFEVMKSRVRSLGDKDSGALGMIASGEADMVAAFMPVFSSANSFITWGREMGQNRYFILMTRPTESAKGSGLLAPFNTEVWVLILVSLLIVGPVIYGFMSVRVYLYNLKNKSKIPLESCYWFAYGALMKQGSSLNPDSDSLRIMISTWWIFILILTAFYTANLTAFLTLSLFTLQINSLQDVAKSNARWFAASGGSIEFTLKNEDDLGLDILLPSLRSGKGKFVDALNGTSPLTMVSQDWLYMDDWGTLTRLVFEDYLRKTSFGEEESKRCTYVITTQAIMSKPLAFAYSNISILPHLFDPIIQTFIESGILQHLTSEGLPVSPICPLNLGNKERRLRNSDLWATYVVVITGYCVAFTMFCCEIIFRMFCKKHNSQKLQPIHDSITKLDQPIKIPTLSARIWPQYDNRNQKPNQFPADLTENFYVLLAGNENHQRMIFSRPPY